VLALGRGKWTVPVGDPDNWHGGINCGADPDIWEVQFNMFPNSSFLFLHLRAAKSIAKLDVGYRAVKNSIKPQPNNRDII